MVEGADCGGRCCQQQGPLAEVVEDEAGENDGEPGKADRPASEMADIGIESFTSGHDQEDRPQDDEASGAVVEEEPDSIARTDRSDDRGV